MVDVSGSQKVCTHFSGLIKVGPEKAHPWTKMHLPGGPPPNHHSHTLALITQQPQMPHTWLQPSALVGRTEEPVEFNDMPSARPAFSPTPVL